MWGVIEETDVEDRVVAYHVAPVVRLDGDVLMSGAHAITRECPCRPHREESYGVTLWLHHDPDAPGALSGDEWKQRVNV